MHASKVEKGKRTARRSIERSGIQVEVGEHDEVDGVDVASILARTSGHRRRRRAMSYKCGDEPWSPHVVTTGRISLFSHLTKPKDPYQ